MKLSEVLSTLAAPFKTLPQATAALEPAKATLDSVNALFTAAGLQLEPMLAAGPDSLKAHLESIDNTEELAEALQENERITAELETAKVSGLALNSQLSALNASFAAVGITSPATATHEEIKTAFDSHIAKQVTLSLAKSGHPPAHVPSAGNPEETAPKTAESIFAEYQGMAASDLKQAFYAKHERAIWAGKRAADAKA